MYERKDFEESQEKGEQVIRIKLYNRYYTAIASREESK